MVTTVKADTITVTDLEVSSNADLKGPNRFNNNRRPMNNRNKAPKQLLVSREQLEQIELLYKLMLPLPNPDAHEVIGEKIGFGTKKSIFRYKFGSSKNDASKITVP